MFSGKGCLTCCLSGPVRINTGVFPVPVELSAGVLR